MSKPTEHRATRWALVRLSPQPASFVADWRIPPGEHMERARLFETRAKARYAKHRVPNPWCVRVVKVSVTIREMP